LEDAEKCIELKPDWTKGYQRKGMALQASGKLDEALDAYKLAVEKDPNNSQAVGMLAKCEE